MPQINVNFSEVGAPTGKQIDFVQEMCRELKKSMPIEMPEYTFEAYSEFISEWRDIYYDLMSCQNYLDQDNF